jgi:hypothetical protein
MSKRLINFTFILVFVFLISATAKAEIFFAYLTPAQEVPTNASTATGYARINVNESALTISYTIVFNGLAGTQNGAHIHAPAAIGANVGVAITFPNIGGTSGTISGSTTITALQLSQIRQHLGYVNVHSTTFPGGEIRGQLGPKRPVDFDGDGRQDYSVLRFPATGDPRPIQYWNLNSTSGVQISGQFGDALRDFPSPGDYDGDGKDDYALYRAGTAAVPQGSFWILTSGSNTVLYFAWGITGDQGVARDYDGDGITDVAVTRRGAANTDPLVWYIRNSTNGSVRVVHWGISGITTTAYDAPIPCDYDGDGKYDIAVYRFFNPPANTYHILRSSDLTAQMVTFGNFNTDYILPGDYDGDGKCDFMAARTGAAGTSPMVWWLLTATGVQSQRTFGISSDLPVQGDYDGDAKTDMAIAREAGAAVATNFWVFNSFTNTATTTQWGLGADFPTATFDAR